MSDLYIYDFGIFIEVAPDEEQKSQLEANIQMALSKGDINLEDAIHDAIAGDSLRSFFLIDSPDRFVRNWLFFSETGQCCPECGGFRHAQTGKPPDFRPGVWPENRHWGDFGS